MKNKKTIAIIIFSLTALIFILGAIQLFMFIPSQLKLVSSARADAIAQQGSVPAELEEQISTFFKEQFVPQVIAYLIPFLGFVSVLISLGLISIGLMKKEEVISENDGMAQLNHYTSNNESDDDDLFDGFDVVENEIIVEDETTAGDIAAEGEDEPESEI